MKKLLLGLGTITAVAVPVIAVVSCGEMDSEHLTNVVARKNTEKIVDAIKELTEAVKDIK